MSLLVIYSCFGDKNESLIITHEKASQNKNYTILVSTEDGNKLYHASESFVQGVRGDQLLNIRKPAQADASKAFEMKIEKVEIPGNKYELRGNLKAGADEKAPDIELNLSCST